MKRMSIVSIIFALFIGGVAFGAHVKIEPGETIEIEADHKTTVTCGGSEQGDLKCHYSLSDLSCRASYVGTACYNASIKKTGKCIPNNTSGSGEPVCACVRE